LAAFLPNGVWAQTPPPAATAPTITPNQAQQAIDSLQDPQKRDQLIAMLKAIAAAPVVAPAPAAPAVTLNPNSLGVQLLITLTHWSTGIADEISAIAATTANLPMLWQWLAGIANDIPPPRLRC
jgi:hypothetical protein